MNSLEKSLVALWKYIEYWEMAFPMGMPLAQEVIYQRALAIEMKLQGLTFVREQEMEIGYKGEHIGTRRVDFFVEDKIMVELKAVSVLDNDHLAEAINYLEAYGLSIGLLINFGSRSLVYKRVMKPKAKS